MSEPKSTEWPRTHRFERLRTSGGLRMPQIWHRLEHWTCGLSMLGCQPRKSVAEKLHALTSSMIFSFIPCAMHACFKLMKAHVMTQQCQHLHVDEITIRYDEQGAKMNESLPEKPDQQSEDLANVQHGSTCLHEFLSDPPLFSSDTQRMSY